MVAIEHVGVRRDEQVRHEVHDVARGEVRTGVLVVGLGEPLDEVLEDVAHVDRLDLVGRHVRLRGAEVLDDLVQQGRIGVGEPLDLVDDLHARQDVLHIVGEAIEVVLEVLLDVLGISLQRLEGELRSVVEGVPRGFSEEAVLDSEALVLLDRLLHSVVRWRQTVMEALDDCHRQDHETVLVGLVWSAQGVRDAPDEGCLLLYVDADRADQLIALDHVTLLF